MSDNDPDGIENATHNTFAKLSLLFFRLQMHCGLHFYSIVVILDCKCIVVAFSIPSCSLSLVKYLYSEFFCQCQN
jgi:hypothetical protein